MYSKKKLPEELPLEPTTIWQCTKEGCNGWMRDNFTFEAEPTCHLCSSPMQRDSKMLPSLVNTTSDPRSLK